LVALVGASNVAQKLRHIDNFDWLDNIVLCTSIKAPSFTRNFEIVKYIVGNY
jgi:hypothetical protein